MAPNFFPMQRRELWQRFFHHPFAWGGLSILSVIGLFALIAPFLTPYLPEEIHLPLKNSPPGGTFWFGTDELGRDLFARTAYGARISLFVGIAASFVDLLIGVTYGAFSALSSKMTDEILMRCADILYALPYLLLVIVLLVVLGPGLTTLISALTLTGWINMARLTRMQILQLKQLDFVKAAFIMGASKKRILFTHLLPNMQGTILVTLTLTIPSAIFAEAFLSFLGLGMQAPSASLGTLVNEGISALRYFPWRLFFPAGCISLILLGFHLVTEALQEILHPLQKEKS